MDFSDALRQLTRGARISRAGWYGGGTFLYLVPGSHFNVNRAPLLGIYEEGDEVDYRPHIDMRTAKGDHVPWSATQTDLLATDWTVVAGGDEDGDVQGFEANEFKLPVYKSHKIVAAAKIGSIANMGDGTPTHLELLDTDGVKLRDVTVPWAYMEKHEPHPGGYFVQYEDGYQSFSPAPAFEGGYTRI